MLDEGEVLRSNEGFYLAFERRDLGAMDGLWSRTAPVACIHPGWGPIVGRDAVMRSWLEILANPSSPEVSCESPRVSLLGDVAYVICMEHVTLPSENQRGVFVATNAFVREDGAWRLVLHQSSPVADELLPPDEGPRPSQLN
ncbi:MAG: nuclear transport factor 2 family protein [Polyangiales bacterium]